MPTFLYYSQRLILGLILAVGLAACSDEKQTQVNYDPVAFHSDDECHICGMIISDFPGPKGEAIGRDGVRKFCSTSEMLGWWLQPENQISDARLYVHDMGKSHWDQPDDAHLIDATQAWYVLGTPLKGAMGASLASFAQEVDARDLASQHNGRVVRFEDIDQALLQQTIADQHTQDQHHVDTAHDHTEQDADHNEH